MCATCREMAKKKATRKETVNLFIGCRATSVRKGRRSLIDKSLILQILQHILHFFFFVSLNMKSFLYIICLRPFYIDRQLGCGIHPLSIYNIVVVRVSVCIATSSYLSIRSQFAVNFRWAYSRCWAPFQLNHSTRFTRTAIHSRCPLLRHGFRKR